MGNSSRKSQAQGQAQAQAQPQRARRAGVLHGLRRPHHTPQPQAARRNSGRRASGRRASKRRFRPPRAGAAPGCVAPRPGDVLFGPIDHGGDESLLAVHEEWLRGMREDIEQDPDGFLLDNLLFSVQYFKDYEREVRTLREAAELPGLGGLGGTARRDIQPDSLPTAAGRRVRWAAHPEDPDDLLLLTPQRHFVLSDNVRLIGGLSEPIPAPRSAAVLTIVVEAADKVGYVKLRRVGDVGLGDKQSSRSPQPALRIPRVTAPTNTTLSGGSPPRHSPNHEGGENADPEDPIPDAATQEARSSSPSNIGAISGEPEPSPEKESPERQSTPDIRGDVVTVRDVPSLNNNANLTPDLSWLDDDENNSFLSSKRVSELREELTRRFNSNAWQPVDVSVSESPEEQPKHRLGNRPWASNQMTELMSELQGHPRFKLNAPAPPSDSEPSPSVSASNNGEIHSSPQTPGSTPSTPSVVLLKSELLRSNGETTLNDVTLTPTTEEEPQPKEGIKPTPKARTVVKPKTTAPTQKPPTPDSKQKSLMPDSGTNTVTVPEPPQEHIPDSLTAAGNRGSFSIISDLGNQLSVPLDDFRLRATPEETEVIPSACFKPHMVILGRQHLESGVGDSHPKQNGTDAPEMALQLFLSPAVYMASFTDVFAKHLASAMGFSQESVASARVRPGAVLCEDCEVIPGLRLPTWPAIAAEWLLRARADWPPALTLRRVHELGAVVVPSSGSPISAELHWQLAFPEAERLLELSMSASQAHGYLSLMALHRCFLEQLGLPAAYLLSFYLSHCEQQAERVGQAPWPQPGHTLLAQLAALHAALQSRTLPDYFVSRRNLLSELPPYVLRRLQGRVFRLRERLLPSVLLVCRRLTYVTGDKFYPCLDYDRLATILSLREDGVDEDAPLQVEEQEHPDTGTDQLRQNPELSLQSRLGRGSEETMQRTRGVLTFFCKHFSRMAECSAELGVLGQSLQYLQHCYHLYTILTEDYSGSLSTSDIRNEIKAAEAALLIRLRGTRQN